MNVPPRGARRRALALAGMLAGWPAVRRPPGVRSAAGLGAALALPAGAGASGGGAAATPAVTHPAPDAAGRGRAGAFAAVTPRPLVFPRDHGAHPDFRTEWWYLTGWLDGPAGPLGIQVTFFRVATGLDAAPSRFSPAQLIVAHAAVADPARGRLLAEEGVARAGFDLVGAATADTDVRLDRWFLRRAPDGAYASEIAGRSFALRFTATPTQPLLLQGETGWSSKGPRPEQASHYYTQPQLALQADLERDGARLRLSGRAWLDHEWSSTLLDDAAAGWDWIGMNLDDGSALTAFVVRRRGDGSTLWAYASLRTPDGRLRRYGPDAVRFTPLAHWTSPRTRAVWPVAQRIAVGGRQFDTRPLLPDQELDSRRTTGAVYWEGASTLLEAGRPVGRGYLEMTGYLEPIRL